MNKTAILALMCAPLWLGLAPHAHAETVVVDGRLMVEHSDVARPSGGMTMAQVKARFGDPLVRHPTVGKPPITRWDYARFAVFFEGNRVIDAVVTPTPAHTVASTTTAAAGH